ncbi:hypothetical protein CCYA_CCYA02G0476 [Cyanidiococcus yangmingshanensis]|nr:hypothetical protein CCYA_CCYA02G0476 [Cyanidiococcus yangmingshanensis]
MDTCSEGLAPRVSHRHRRCSSTNAWRLALTLLVLWLAFLVSLLAISPASADQAFQPSAHIGSEPSSEASEGAAKSSAVQRPPVGGSSYFFGHIFVKPDPKDVGEALGGQWLVDIQVLSMQSGKKLPPNKRWPSARAQVSFREFASYKPPPARGALEQWLIPEGPLSGSWEFKDDRGKRVARSPFRLIRLETNGPWSGRFTLYDLKDTEEAEGGPQPANASVFHEWFRFELERLPQSGIWSTRDWNNGNNTIATKEQRTEGPPNARVGLLHILDRNHFLIVLVDKDHDEVVYLSGLRGDTILPNSHMSKLGPALFIGLISIGSHLAFYYLNRHSPRQRLATHAAIARAVHARDRDQMWRQQYEHTRLDTPRPSAVRDDDKRE